MHSSVHLRYQSFLVKCPPITPRKEPLSSTADEVVRSDFLSMNQFFSIVNCSYYIDQNHKSIIITLRNNDGYD